MKFFQFIFLLTILNFIQTGRSHANISGPIQDPEQQQLEWCFIFSNLLGFNMQYVTNPRLYYNIGDWMGTPYKYSGKSKSGIDCSGFVCKMLNESYNIPISGSSRDLFDQVKVVNTSELKEGDLVFFKIRKGRISHVGIYLGNGKFAHSSTTRGVIISDLSENYYDRHFYKAGRLKK
ncbi:MAG: glycoside hydrolase [Bacteroidetes bacterium]|nr:MAG: glycoside hydrolase [Bacteroidota bacterium]REK06986.1 MAG: glycoside hydrolase [Bacteroidota bacterium]REK33666.1 MAG: glycoside hydrolase [Bacteroidota bacterium]REK48652.1 MAG: glycoside hydrolase [Bacteroidota bacterium]